MYRDANEVESFGVESPILTGRLRALLEHLGITTAPWHRIKEVPRSGRVEFKEITEIFFGSRVLSYPAFMPKPSTHRMHDPGLNVPHIQPKEFTENQMS
jgi:hypothetical protein